ncbi:MAG: hypothetical protein JNK52_02590 [Zoogloeaceae bacterium]|nr:hypothetical protein [Zoogloeaceae bacterium]
MNVSLAITLAIQVLATMAALTVPVLAPAVALTTGMPASLVGVFIALVYAGAMASSEDRRRIRAFETGERLYLTGYATMRWIAPRSFGRPMLGA